MGWQESRFLWEPELWVGRHVGACLAYFSSCCNPSSIDIKLPLQQSFLGCRLTHTAESGEVQVNKLEFGVLNSSGPKMVL